MFLLQLGTNSGSLFFWIVNATSFSTKCTMNVVARAHKAAENCANKIYAAIPARKTHFRRASTLLLTTNKSASCWVPIKRNVAGALEQACDDENSHLAQVSKLWSLHFGAVVINHASYDYKSIGLYIIRMTKCKTMMRLAFSGLLSPSFLFNIWWSTCGVVNIFIFIIFGRIFKAMWRWGEQGTTWGRIMAIDDDKATGYYLFIGLHWA